MHLRISTKKKNRHVYKYAQIVQSFRRDDGVPTHKVIANLGRLSEQEIANLRVALQASRQGRALVLPGDTAHKEWQAKIVASLKYLEVAVALETWRRWKLPGLFNRLLRQGNDAIPPSAVIASLVIHRCTDPGSKLYAQRWFPRTALPELLDVEPSQFGNTRIHRALEGLDRIEDTLQTELVKRYRSKDGLFATIFMDVTDAWFAGRGCDLAERDRTKEGFSNRHKIGIVLVCNEHGYPLRWKVVPGKRRDPLCMGDMLQQIQDEDWIGDAPLVCDRAMGKAKSVAKFVESGVRFLTATTRNEITSYTDAIPYEPFLDLSPVGSEITLEAEMKVAARMAEEAGLKKVDDFLFVHDLGICERTLSFERARHEFSGAAWDPDELEGGASFIALARIFQDLLNKKEFRNKSELAQKQGLTRARVTQIMNTIKIDKGLQEQILLGEFGYVPETLLQDCVKCGAEPHQRRLLEENAKIVRPAKGFGKPKPPRRVGRQKVQLRLVAYFNPQMFVEQRARISKRRQRIESHVANLNCSLRSPDSKRKKNSIQVEVHNQLARWKMLSIFSVRVVSLRDKDTGQLYWRVRLKFDPQEWLRRIRFAGFVLLVGHPDLPHSAEDIVRLYRQKDTVEKDFQTIKNVVKLRPLYHHTDAKVRAHVTLCMLALLLERTIERRLKRSGLVRTAAACFEELRGCHLNLISSDHALEPTYVATEPTQSQLAILRNLRMRGLVELEEISESIKLRRSQ
jgi:transposase